MKGCYKIAGHVVEIESIYEKIHTMCVDYRTTLPAEYSIVVTNADIEKERDYSRMQQERELQMITEYPDDYLETLAVYRQMAVCMIQYDTLLFHGSVVAVNNVGYLFTAKSGVGKSTHTSLWRKLLGKQAVMVNDDKPLIRFIENKAVVCGTPWNGKHHLSSNVEVPLRSICLLERGLENQIRKITPVEATTFLLKQTYLPEDRTKLLQVLSLVNRLSSSVALYHLQCNMDLSAAELSYGVMSGQIPADK